MTTTLEEAAQQLSESADYRLLRRVPPVERWSFPESAGEVLRGVVVDCETTGLGDDDEPIELAVIPFDYDKETGRIVSVHQALTGLREPSKAIPVEAERVHGISQEMVAGKTISNDEVAAAIGDAKIVIAHNASFDRPKCERTWAAFEDIGWACSCDEIDWRAEGFASRGLEYLLMKQGWFFDGHRAMGDALATLFALTLTLPLSGKPALAELLERARRPLFLIRAVDTDYDHREELKSHGYRWQQATEHVAKAWELATNDPEKEVGWLKTSTAWTANSRVAHRAVPPRLRYSDRLYGTKGAA